MIIHSSTNRDIETIVLFAHKKGAASSIDYMIGFAQHDAQPYVTANGDGMPEDKLNVASTNESLALYFALATAHYPQGIGIGTA